MSVSKIVRTWLAGLSVTLLAACGGGGGSAGASLFGGPDQGSGTATASDLVVVLDKSTVTNGAGDSVVATVTALDGNRNALPGVAVAVTVDSDAIAALSGGTTDTDGKVTATVTIGANRTPRTITVTASASGLTRAQTFSVTNEQGGGGSAAAALVVVLDKATIDNSGSQSVQATVTALDANRRALAGIPVDLSVDNGAFVQSGAAVTGANGQLTAAVSIGADRSLRTVNVTARSGTVGAAQSFQVVGSATAGGTTASDLVVVLDRTTLSNTATDGVVATVTTLDANRNALANVPVQVTVDSGAIATVSSATSDGSGQVKADVTLGADKSLRTVTVTARTGTLARAQTFQVTNGAGGGSLSAADLVLQLNKTVVNTTGTDQISATVVALDANRNAVAGIPVTVSVNNNAVATVSSGSTNTSGIVTATLTPGSDRSARVVTVTASSGSVIRTATFEVSASSSTSAIQADSIVLALSSRAVANTGSETVTATITALDARRNAVAGVPVQFSIDNGGVIVPAGTVTGADGTISAVARIGVDRSSRVISITATSGTKSATDTFRVEGAALSATLVPAVIPLAGSSGNQVQYRLIDRNANPMVGFPVVVSAPGLTTVTGVTGSNGEYNYVYTAPSLPPGTTLVNLVITAEAAGTTRSDTVQIGVAAKDPAVGPVVTASVDVSPSVVSVNTGGSTSNRSELRAIFLGANNKPIPNVRVVFDLNTDVNTIGGSVTSGTQVVYTNENGVATASYVPGSRSSPTDGVTVRACYALTGSSLTCPNTPTTAQTVGASAGQVTKNLTVVSEAVSVSIGTDELIALGAGTYIKDFVVMVVDSAGNAKPDVVVSASLDLTGYLKGSYFFDTLWRQSLSLDEFQGYRWNSATTSWEQLPLAPTAPTANSGVFFPGLGLTLQPLCPGEDVDRNSSLLAGSGTPGSRPLNLRAEDLNDNGSLDPRKSDVSVRVVSPGSRTGTNGTAIVRLEYPRNYATWVDYRITVQVTGVTGTEGRATYTGTRYGLGNLPAPGSAFTDPTVAPAFATSPYGRSNTCQDDK